MKFIALALLLCAAIFALPASAQTATVPPTPLEQRADDVLKFLQGTLKPEQVFAPTFLAAVSPAQLAAINQDLTRSYGKATVISRLDKKSDTNAVLLIDFDKGYRATVNIDIGGAAPHLVDGLLLTSTEKIDATLDGIVAELKRLPGQTALTVARLNDDGFAPVVSYNSDAPLAIGSAFKLYVLGELTRSVAAGERNWADIIALRESSFPSGFLQDWPAGSPLTLHTLAGLMISQSDNTATDQLIETLGREKIERILPTLGNAHAARNIPFLKTRELFALKGAPTQDNAKRYVNSSVAAKRELLAGTVANFKTEDLNAAFLLKPTYLNQLEWFASTDDLVRALNWLRLHSETAPTRQVRGILSINKALTADAAARWNYVGFKGGSETGVLNLSYLLQAENGQWFAVSASWNDENAAVDDKQFVFLIQQAIELARPK